MRGCLIDEEEEEDMANFWKAWTALFNTWFTLFPSFLSGGASYRSSIPTCLAYPVGQFNVKLLQRCSDTFQLQASLLLSCWLSQSSLDLWLWLHSGEAIFIASSNERRHITGGAYRQTEGILPSPPLATRHERRHDSNLLKIVDLWRAISMPSRPWAEKLGVCILLLSSSCHKACASHAAGTGWGPLPC